MSNDNQCLVCGAENARQFDTHGELFCSIKHFKEYHLTRELRQQERFSKEHAEQKIDHHKILEQVLSPTFLAGEFQDMTWEQQQQWIVDNQKTYDLHKKANIEAQKISTRKLQMRLDSSAVAGIDRTSPAEIRRTEKEYNSFQKTILSFIKQVKNLPLPNPNKYVAKMVKDHYSYLGVETSDESILTEIEKINANRS